MICPHSSLPTQVLLDSAVRLQQLSCMGEGGRRRRGGEGACMWRSEDNFVELVLLPPLHGFWALSSGVCGEHSFPLSHLQLCGRGQEMACRSLFKQPVSCMVLLGPRVCSHQGRAKPLTHLTASGKVKGWAKPCWEGSWGLAFSLLPSPSSGEKPHLCMTSQWGGGQHECHTVHFNQAPP